MRSARLHPPSWAVAAFQASFTALWSWAFRLAGTLGTRRVTWIPTGGLRVLVVAPHPDDEVVGCGGAILRHVAAGDEVTVVHATDGRMSRAFGLEPGEMAARRHEEAHAAARLLGVGRVAWLGLAEGAWQPGNLEARLGAILAGSSPDLVYAPSRADFHPEHHRVAHALALASASLRHAARVRVYQVQVPLTAALVNCVVSIASQTDGHAAALRAHATQYGSIARCTRMKRYAACRHGLDGLAEEFWEMSGAAYRALHAGPPERWTRGAFRGMRYAAAGDPLSYLAGRRARRGLRRAAAEAGS
jgi:LmbE family N-acetylglucosaminyl deacetylase